MAFLMVLGIILVVSSTALIRSGVLEDEFSRVRPSDLDRVMAILFFVGWLCIAASALWWSLT